MRGLRATCIGDMFGKVWRWAGTYRTTNKNLGVDRTQIQPQLYQAIDDARFRSESKTYWPDEIAVPRSVFIERNDSSSGITMTPCGRATRCIALQSAKVLAVIVPPPLLRARADEVIEQPGADVRY
jgi:hypothetical protein